MVFVDNSGGLGKVTLKYLKIKDIKYKIPLRLLFCLFSCIKLEILSKHPLSTGYHFLFLKSCLSRSTSYKRSDDDKTLYIKA